MKVRTQSPIVNLQPSMTFIVASVLAASLSAACSSKEKPAAKPPTPPAQPQQRETSPSSIKISCATPTGDKAVTAPVAFSFCTRSFSTPEANPPETSTPETNTPETAAEEYSLSDEQLSALDATDASFKLHKQLGPLTVEPYCAKHSIIITPPEQPSFALPFGAHQTFEGEFELTAQLAQDNVESKSCQTPMKVAIRGKVDCPSQAPASEPSNRRTPNVAPAVEMAQVHMSIRLLAEQLTPESSLESNPAAAPVAATPASNPPSNPPNEASPKSCVLKKPICSKVAPAPLACSLKQD